MFSSRKARREMMRQEREGLTPNQRFRENVRTASHQLLLLEITVGELVRREDEGTTLREWFTERHDRLTEMRQEFEALRATLFQMDFETGLE